MKKTAAKMKPPHKGCGTCRSPSSISSGGKTRPRLGEPLARELAAYSQAIAQMAERREGSENRTEQSSPTRPDHRFARSPRVIRGAEANDLIERTIVRDIP